MLIVMVIHQQVFTHVFPLILLWVAHRQLQQLGILLLIFKQGFIMKRQSALFIERGVFKEDLFRCVLRHICG